MFPDGAVWSVLKETLFLHPQIVNCMNATNAFWTRKYQRHIAEMIGICYRYVSEREPNFHSYQGALPLFVGIGVSVGRPL